MLILRLYRVRDSCASMQSNDRDQKNAKQRIRKSSLTTFQNCRELFPIISHVHKTIPDKKSRITNHVSRTTNRLSTRRHRCLHQNLLQNFFGGEVLEARGGGKDDAVTQCE